MDFSTEFFWHSLRAAGFALLFFGFPGLWTALLLGLRVNLSALFIAPALGLCVYGPFSLLFTWLLGFSGFTVSAAWLLFQGSAALTYFKYTRRACSDSSFSQMTPLPFLSVPGVIWLLPAAALWALLPAIDIYPMIYKEGLFVNSCIFDQLKVAFVDGITREGMPPMNPFYAPGGERIPLIYYYAWHFLGAQIKSLSGVSGWQAEVALTWFTSFSIAVFLAALAVRFSGRLWAGFVLLLLGLAGGPGDLLPPIMGARWDYFFSFSLATLDNLYPQLSWAPQHVFAAFSTVLLLFLVTRALLTPHLRWCYAGIIGLIAAMGFGASVWVGGVALLLVLPALLFTLWRLRLDYGCWWGPLLLAICVCVLFSLPVLSSIISGPEVAGEFPLAFKLFYATKVIGQDTHLGMVTHVVLFWLQILPLSLGVVYILGLFAVLAYAPNQKETRIFKYLSMAVIVADLLAVQWVQSVIMNNDFGWRTVAVPVMLLLVWAAVVLADISGSLINWHGRKILLSGRKVFVPLIWIGITVGMLATFALVSWPRPPGILLSSKQLAWHQDFFRQREAWAAVRRHTGPSDLVQNNPDTYAKLVTAWPGPASVALFGDRPVAYTDPESVNVFAHPYDQEQKNVQGAAVRALFVAQPELSALTYARDTLKIRALMVEIHDPVWYTQSIEDSGIYRLVETTEQFKIYLADVPSE